MFGRKSTPRNTSGEGTSTNQNTGDEAGTSQNNDQKPKKKQVHLDTEPMIPDEKFIGKVDGKRILQPSVSAEHLSHFSRRRSLDRGSDISETLVSHALHEVVSDANIIAGPRGALFGLRSSFASLDGKMSIASTHTIERLLIRKKTMEGYDIAADFDDAIAETGHGRFQYKLMALCGFIYSCCSLSTTTLSFVLPAAQNDFQLDSFDKGFLNTAPLWGMVIGAYIWGNFADSKGRKFVLLFSLLTDAIAAFVSSFAQKYMQFFICRIFNGFGIIGATSIVFAYLGEFIDPLRRDHYLSRLELFWTFGIIALPVIGFAILPHKWTIGSHDTFMFDTWRLFVFTCGLPSLLAAILISRMPESPRFLFLQGHQEKTRQVLMRMYASNTRKSPDTFPVKILSLNQQEADYYFPNLHGVSFCVKLKKIFHGLARQHRDLLYGRSLLNIILTCFIDFGLMSVYYAIMLWVPELLHRMEEYELRYPTATDNLCQISKVHIEDEAGGEVNMGMFIHTFIVCMACLPSNVLLLFLISYISKKALLVALMLFAAVPTAALGFMDSEFKVTTMLCVFEACSTLVEAVLFCAIVEIFPLSNRGTALSLTVTIGRLGAVLGNISFGLFIDNHCMHLYFTMASTL